MEGVGQGSGRRPERRQRNFERLFVQAFPTIPLPAVGTIPAVETGARLATVTVLVTDLVGSTAVLDREGEPAADEMRRRHGALVRTIVDVFDGTTVKSTGDGFLATFHSADAAVRCAAALLEASDEGAVRLGLSTGDATVAADDVFGQPAIEAARLCAMAGAGEALVGERTVAVRGRRDAPPLESRGACRLKGFDDAIEVAAVRPARPVPPRRRRALTPVAPLVGRSTELAQLRQAWERAADAPGVALVTGEPGIGKTHLAAALAHQVDAQGFVARVGFEEGRADGFERLCTHLDELATNVPIGRLAAHGRAVTAWLATLCPSIAERVPLSTDTAVDAPRDEAAAALVVLLEELARRERVLLVLDDVQWSGAAVEALVTRLRQEGPAGVLVLATARLSTAPAALVELATDDGSVVTLHGLAADEVGELLRHAAPDATPELVEAVQQRTGGNPFLVLTLVEQEPDTSDGDPVATRFLHLPREVADAMSAAAILGRTFDADLLEHVLGETMPVLLDRLDAARRAGLLVEGERAGRYSFAHDLVRDAAAGRLGLTARARLHALAASALAERDTSSSELVEHLLASWSLRPPAEGVALAERAVRRAIDHLAFEEALALATRIDAAVHDDPRCGAAERAQSLLMLSAAHQRVGDIPAHKATAGAAGWAARDAGRTDLLARAAIGRAGYGIAGVPDPESEALLRAALDATAEDELAQRSDLLGMLAFYLYNYVGQGAAARSLSRQSLEIARRSGDITCVAQALAMRTYIHLAGSALDEQLAVLGELNELTPRLEPQARDEMVATAARHAAVARMQLGDRSGFEVHHANLRRMADRNRSWLLGGLSVAWDAMAALLDGDVAAAERAGTALLVPPYQDSNFRSSAALILTEVHRHRGTLSSVAAEISRFADSMPHLVTARAVDAFVAASVGDVDRATVALEAGSGRLQDDSTLPAQLAFATEAHVLAGRPIPDSIVEALEPFAGQLLVVAWGVSVQGAADRFLAIAAAQRGQLTEAATRFDAAAELERRVGEALPARTGLWRHALLRDVPRPEVPAAIAPGLSVELAALERALSPTESAPV
jgi:class 3 adenylate cyclase